MNALALLVATAVAAADAALTNVELKNATAEWIDACAPSLTSEAGEVTCPPVDRAACDAVEAEYGSIVYSIPIYSEWPPSKGRAPPDTCCAIEAEASA